LMLLNVVETSWRLVANTAVAADAKSGRSAP
jgi:hypothetical protein